MIHHGARLRPVHNIQDLERTRDYSIRIEGWRRTGFRASWMVPQVLNHSRHFLSEVGRMRFLRLGSLDLAKLAGCAFFALDLWTCPPLVDYGQLARPISPYEATDYLGHIFLLVLLQSVLGSREIYMDGKRDAQIQAKM